MKDIYWDEATQSIQGMRDSTLAPVPYSLAFDEVRKQLGLTLTV